MPVLITMVTRCLTLDTLTATLMHFVFAEIILYFRNYILTIPATQVVAQVLYTVSNNSILQISSGILGLNEFWPAVLNNKNSSNLNQQ